MEFVIRTDLELDAIAVRFQLCVIDIFFKYAWVIPLKDKKEITITNGFKNFLDESNGKPNKLWVDKGSDFCNRSMKSWLEKNNTEIYSTCDEGKSVAAERFITTLKNKIYNRSSSHVTKIRIFKNLNLRKS